MIRYKVLDTQPYPTLIPRWYYQIYMNIRHELWIFINFKKSMDHGTKIYINRAGTKIKLKKEKK